MKTKYKEIFKLKKMLDNAGIPYEWQEDWGLDKDVREKIMTLAPDILEHYHLGYPVLNSEKRWISVIEGFGTYGAEEDKLEIMGGFTPWEQFSERDEVIGHLTARNVFNRIKKDWEERKSEKEDNKS